MFIKLIIIIIILGVKNNTIVRNQVKIKLMITIIMLKIDCQIVINYSQVKRNYIIILNTILNYHRRRIIKKVILLRREI